MGELTRGKVIAAACGVALIAVMFLSWFDYSNVGGVDISARATAAGIDTTQNAWQAFALIDLVLVFTGLAAVVAAVISARSGSARASVSPEALVFGLGVLSTLLVLYRILDPVDDANRRLGLFLGFLAAAGIAAGGWIAMQEAAPPQRTRRRAAAPPPSSPTG
jgi:hypothetical protein